MRSTEIAEHLKYSQKISCKPIVLRQAEPNLLKKG